MRKAISILPVVSAIYPIITGTTAPPTNVMMSREKAKSTSFERIKFIVTHTQNAHIGQTEFKICLF